MRFFALLFSTMFFFSGLFGQDPGIRLYSGISSQQNRVLAVTPNGTYHSGYHFGADGRLNGGRMFFVIGARYTSVDLTPTNSLSFFENNTLHSILSARIGLGWHLIQLGPESSVRGKVLAQLDSNLNFDADVLESPYDELVDAAAGVTIGLGLELKFFTVDLEYEYGLVNVYSQQKETKSDAYSLSIGFFF